MSYQEIIYSKNVVEFVTVGIEYCHLVECASESSATDFIDKSTKILPLLYLKASLLPDSAAEQDEMIEEFVTEESYAVVVNSIATLLKEKDDYLETFHPEMKFSDTAVLASISEDLADIYQDVKNFVMVFSIGHEPSMHDAMVMCRDNFGTFWGQKLVNAMGALHHLKYNAEASELYDEEDDALKEWL